MIKTLDEAILLLAEHGREIGEKAAGGSKGAQGIIRAYTLVHSRPNDPGASGLLIAMLNEYLKRR